MPHVLIELTNNVAERLDVNGAVHAIHRRLAETGLLPVKAIKTRALVHTHFEIGDAAGSAGFATVLIRIQPGRPLESEQAIAQAAFDAVEAVTANIDIHVSISVDVQHIYREASLSRV